MPTKPRRLPGPCRLDPTELHLISTLEGKPLPRARDLAHATGMSLPAAFRFLSKMQRAGVLQQVAVVLRRLDHCQCVSYLKARLDEPALRNRLEDRLRADPSIIQAARLSGHADYRVASLHVDRAAARVWHAALLSDPAVTSATLEYLDIIVSRTQVAGALTRQSSN